MSADLLTQLNEQKRKVDFDSFDISVKELVNMVEEGIIDIAPDYQRKFRWKADRQSELIESIFLGLPIPSLFMAANADGTWEVIDGVQRLSSLVHFLGSDAAKQKIGINSTLKLIQLEKLTTFNQKTFVELPKTIQLQVLLKSLRITSLTDKSDKKVRFDLFERLNTGGIALSYQEIRAAVYLGSFNDTLRRLANKPVFRKVVKVARSKEYDGTPEELVLRFFAYFHEYQNFTGGVKGFLNTYMEKALKSFDYENDILLFDKVFCSLAEALPEGIRRPDKTVTPMSLYEAVAVGAALAYVQNKTLVMDGLDTWMHSDELHQLTTGSTNSKKQVIERIEFCRDRFLGV